MATGMELVLNLRSAREWRSGLEEGAALGAGIASAESARRLEKILAAARQDGLTVQQKARRRATSTLLEDLALQEAQVNGAIQYLERRQASGAQLEGEWRALTSNAKTIEEGFGESRAALTSAAELPVLAAAPEERLRVRVVAERFLEAAAFHFERGELIAYLTGLQEEAELTNAEISALKGFLTQTLLEQVAVHARKLVMPGRNSHSTEKETAGLKLVLSSLRVLGVTDWDEVFVETSLSEQALAQDPVRAFERMEKAAKSDYRAAAAEFARKSGESEAEVARRAVKLAKSAENGGNLRARERRSHVGYYLIGEGRPKLEDALGIKHSLLSRFGSFLKRWPDGLYVVGIELLMIGLLTAVVLGAEIRVPTFLVVALFFLPAAESAVAIANQLAVMFVRPRALPKMDYSGGIPVESKTLVVVPTLLMNRAQMERAVRDLEIRFLGNRDANLHFGLLTDPPDAPTQFDKRDELAHECARLIEQLNERYATQNKGTFFLFHRNRTFNSVEKIWMGWERKRGKLLDLNNLLLGKHNNFSTIAGNQELLSDVRYVITLDADTQLPRDTAHRLVGAIAHPLQRAVIHPNSNVVVEGYGILQPRVGISIHSANRSRLAAMFSGDSTFDVYTRAVSDVYQDLFGEGSFTGKGIYEVEVFQKVVEHRFPSNAILSHDMIEGAYARAGLLSDVEVIDDYPSRIAAYSKRKHRWVRGDWQILFWLFPRVPDYSGKVVRNPINLISRWKIMDNLRRSLTEIAMLAILVSGWMFLPGKALYWTLATLALFAAPTYLQFALAILRSGGNTFTVRFWREWFTDFAAANAHLFMRLVCLPQQSMVTLDAIVRVAARLAVTRRKLLEWETAAEAEADGEKRSPVDIYLAATPWVAFLGGVFLAVDRPESFAIAWPLLLLWGMSRAFSNWLDQPLPEDGLKIRSSDETLLRNSALRTWRFFREFSNENENYLIPDIFKEEGKLTAHRVSTTNLGLLLNARIAALDFGYFTVSEFIAETGKTMATVRRLPKAHGHLYNWYNNQTLEPVGDPFLSTVDNGNLVCCLWTLKQACIEERQRPIFRKELWLSIRDHARLIQQLAPAKGVREAVRTLEECIAERGENASDWLISLPSLGQAVGAVIESAKAASQTSEELQWWLIELSTRVVELQKLALQFAPWASTRFRTLRATSDQQTKWIADLSLATAGRIYEEILETLREESRGPGVEGAAENASRALLLDALQATREFAAKADSELAEIASYANELASGMDFSLVYDDNRKLITIGFDAAKDAASEHHYDLLASEARAAVFVGVAKGEIPQECWFHLDRSHVQYKGERVLQSWTGTMFEYLMPSLWMKSSAGTLLDRNMSSAVRAQQRYARSFRIPWGISESACSLLSGDGHYHYFAFGVPQLALHRPEEERLVISPYSTFMSLMTGSYDALRNLCRLKKMGSVGAYGFYEALDYGPRMTFSRRRFTMVRSWMAHHQGMCLLSIANVLCDSAIQRRFHAEPQVAATERILHERATTAEAVNVSKAQRQRKAEALLAEEQSVLSPKYWEAKDRAQSAA